MNRTGFLLLAFAALLSVGLGSCERDDDNSGSSNSGGNGGESGQTSGDWVDLGLPSGLLWATRNVGASSPEDYIPSSSCFSLSISIFLTSSFSKSLKKKNTKENLNFFET